jgi:hypothetical protein
MGDQEDEREHDDKHELRSSLLEDTCQAKDKIATLGNPQRLNTSSPAARQTYAMHRTKGEVSCDAWRHAVSLWR